MLDGLFAESFQEPGLAGLAQFCEPVEPAPAGAAVKASNQPVTCELRDDISADGKRQPGLAAELPCGERLIHTAEDSLSSVCLV